MSLINTMPS